MQARICDECKKMIEGGPFKSEPLEVTEGNFRLVIDVAERPGVLEDFELCPACVKKGRYQVAKKAFEGLMNRKAKKAATAAPPKTGEGPDKKRAK